MSYLNDTYHLTLNTDNVTNGLHLEKFCYAKYEDTVDWSTLTPVILRYEDIVALILSWFNGRTFEEQAPYELVERCHLAAWRKKDHQANFEQKKNLVKLLGGACDYEELSLREIARRTKLSFQTVQKYAYMEDWSEEKLPDLQAEHYPNLKDFIPIIDDWMEADRKVPRKQRHTATRIYHRLQEELGTPMRKSRNSSAGRTPSFLPEISVISKAAIKTSGWCRTA